MYLKLMIDGATSQPFSASILPPQAVTNSFKEKVIEHSQKIYGRERAMVEKSIFNQSQQLTDKNKNPGLFD